MKNYSYIGISLVVLIFGIIVVPEIVDRVKDKSVVSTNRSDTQEERIASKEPLSYVVMNGEKKRIPEFSFVDQKGDTITNEDYKGKVFIAEFFFTTCPTICPIMNDNLVGLQEEFKGNDNFGVAAFSIDPTYDTPEVLREYAKLHGINHKNWHLMTGKREAIYDLANSGFNIYVGEDPDAEGGFAHSGYFALIDQEGFIRSRKDKFGNPIIYYRGSVKRGQAVGVGEEEPQIDILEQDIKRLLRDGVKK